MWSSRPYIPPAPFISGERAGLEFWFTWATLAGRSDSSTRTPALFANSLMSLFYYLRWIAPTLRRDTPDPGLRSATLWSTRAAVTAALVSVLLGVFSGPLWGVLDGPLLR